MSSDENLHFDNTQETHTSSENHEENDYVLDLNSITISC